MTDQPGRLILIPGEPGSEERKQALIDLGLWRGTLTEPVEAEGSKDTE